MDFCWFVIKWHLLIFHFVALSRRIIKFRMQYERDGKSLYQYLWAKICLGDNKRQWHWTVETGTVTAMTRWCGRVLLLTTWAWAQHLNYAPQRQEFQRAPGTRQQTAKCSDTPDTWTGIILTTIAIKWELNHGVNPRHSSPGQCWISSLNHLKIFWWESIHQNDTIQSSLVVQPIQFRDFSGSV